MRIAENSRRRGTLGSIAIAVLVIAILAANLAASERSDVLVHAMNRPDGKSVGIWTAIIDSEKGSVDKTSILHREVLGDTSWRELGLIPARVLALTDNGNELVLLLQNYSWVWFSYSAEPTSSFRFSYGPPLPDGARIVALAGNAKSLWALGKNPEPANTDAAQPPVTQPAGLRILRLTAGDWEPQSAPWPEAPSQRQLLSMQIIDDEPHLALWTSGTRSIRVYKLTKDADQWTKINEVPLEQDPLEQIPNRIKLLAVERSPAIWCQSDTAVGRIWMHGHWVPLEFPDAQPEPGKVDVTVAGAQIRVVFRRDKDVLEQRYTTSGAPDGKPRPVTYVSQRTATSSNWVGTGVMALIAMLIAAALLRKRNDPGEEDQQNRDE